MHYLYYNILISCLALQVAVDATVSVLTPVSVVVPKNSIYDDDIDFEVEDGYASVATFSNRDATIIDSVINGQLEYAAPSADACSPIAHPFFVKTDEMKNIVLINGGTDKCDFMTKIKNARAVGFEAAILFDPFPGPFNYSDISFPIERSEIDITVALVTYEDGIKLQNYLFPESRKAKIFVEILPTSAYQLALYIGYGFLFVVVAAFVILLGLIFWSTDCCQDCRNKVQRRVYGGYYSI